ncbi:hypothetical protein DM860_002059 [Cuscuta australis]|uniref:Protein TIFY n=1 Tax=Cuscuta australis TaxID=267555 RepID=A0A328DZ50_9ASTE|nr:hypothetical protein DM860_002059 [Cuscuta australis]
MGRNCNLELRLFPPSSAESQQLRHNVLGTLPARSGEKEGNANELTIFYDGKIVACDATELQARAIILLASQERWRGSPSGPPVTQPPPEEYGRPTASYGLSMKRSLQRFLQKRKKRAESAGPYLNSIN